MALRIMSAIVPGTTQTVQDVHGEFIDHADNREILQDNLLAASKQCHVRFGGRMELATEFDQCVSRLCYAFECIFGHGLRAKNTDKLNSAIRHVSDLVSGSVSKMDMVFWPCIKEQLTWHEQERFSILKNVCTDYGRGRAWLRAALNERSLERHLHSIINSDTLAPFYEEWAFIRDQERSAVLPNIAAGLGTIVFAIRVDNDELDNRIENDDDGKCRVTLSEPIITTSIIESARNLNSNKIKKKVPTHIISFDNDDVNEDREFNESAIANISALPDCLYSPMTIVGKETLVALPSTLSTSSPPSSAADKLVSTNKNVYPSSYVDPTTIDNEELPHDEERILTPLTDVDNLCSLVPISPLDQSLDDILVTLPSYMNDNTSEITEHAIEATEPLVGLDSHVNAEKLDINALRIRILALSEVLEQAREDAVSSRSQLARFQRQHQNYLERHEVQLQALNRENELLRQQLRKYVTAVQMLRHDSDTVNISDEEHSRDYHREAQQYQEKLIQVAEMHAELMEFNARLTMQITDRDKFVKRLQAELECLRGPLNDEDLPDEPPCLIHIWIPSAFLTGQTSDIHHVYQIYVRIMDVEWNIYRRYAQFHALYRDLKKHDTIVTTFQFPPKKTIGNKDAEFVEDRRQKLQQWLRRVVARLAHCSPAFSLRPSKQTLINLMPFFGDYSNEGNTRVNTARDHFPTSSPHYTGL